MQRWNYLKEKKEVIEKCRTYFNNNIDKMRYVDCEKYKYPIGSGVTESACKVLIKQRLCGSGMRWKEKGAAAVISLRALSYSGDRWNQFWQKIDANGFALAV